MGQRSRSGGWFVALGALVSKKARRWDVSWMFLACFVGLVAARVVWLGQSPQVLLHQLQSGALLLFTFFMISDPMTIPNRRAARLLYAAVVALAACGWQYGLFKPNALVWALFLCTPLVPLLDRVLPAARFQWRPPGQSRSSHAARPTLLPSRADRLQRSLLASAGLGEGWVRRASATRIASQIPAFGYHIT